MCLPCHGRARSSGARTPQSAPNLAVPFMAVCEHAQHFKALVCNASCCDNVPFIEWHAIRTAKPAKADRRDISRQPVSANLHTQHPSVWCACAGGRVDQRQKVGDIELVVALALNWMSRR